MKNKEEINIIYDENVEVSIQIKWEIEIYVENEFDPYGRWTISDLLIILVQERLWAQIAVDDHFAYADVR
jgi:hypothetical protein